MSISLHVEALRFAYPPLTPATSSAWVIDGIDLSAGNGEWLALMGASDAGKTTLCLLASGLAPSLTGGTLEGHVHVAGRDTSQHLPPALAPYVGLVFQEPAAQLFNPTVEAELAWGLENLGIPRGETRLRIDHALFRFGIDALRDRSPLTLSGGEKRRVALASVLVTKPGLLILDEPMGGLDPLGRSEVLTAFSELLREQGITILMAESDPDAVASFADRLTVLSGGRLTIDGAVHTVLSRSAQLEQAGVAVPQVAQLASALTQRLGTQFEFFAEDEALRSIVRWLGAQSEGQPSPSHVQASVPAREPPVIGEAAIDVEGLWYWYDAEASPVLRGVDLHIGRGEVVAIVGANGSGKTTLVKHLNNLLRPRRGTIRILGQDSRGRSIGESARSVGFLFQSPEQQIFASSVEKEIAFGPRNLGLGTAAVAGRVSNALARFDLARVAHLPPAILSYGLRRRLTLAALAAMAPPILVLDEPTVGLDAAGRRDLVQWLRERQAAGDTIVLVTHDMALVAEFAHRVVVLSKGEVAADGAPGDVFYQPRLLASASLVAPPVVALAQALHSHGLGTKCLTVAQLCDELTRLAGRT